MLKEVTPSGTVGKQVFAAGTQKILCGVLLATSSAVSTAMVVIRNGNASGERVLTLVCGTKNSVSFPMEDMRFDLGMHVKVTGPAATAYLDIC
jgi:hypothetical protein